METLDYTSLYKIVKYQYDKVRLERERLMSEKEKNQRRQLDNLANVYNNPSFKNLSLIIGESKEKVKDDPNSYIYYSKNYI
jgi:hypothetical protein